MPEFLIRALLAGIGVALVAGPLGSFVVWRRMSYFGATLAHSALLGVTLALAFEISVPAGVLGSGAALALVLLALERQTVLPRDTLLGILAHGSLAVGLIGLAFLGAIRVDLMAYLFGDVLAVSWADLAWVWGGGAAVLAVLALIWRRLLAATVHADLAAVEGLRPEAVNLVYVLLLATVIAIAMKIVGALLIVSLLIVPAAAARPLARSPEAMAAIAAAIGVVSVTAGLLVSARVDIPPGPAIVVAATVLFALSLGLRGRFAT